MSVSTLPEPDPPEVIPTRVDRTCLVCRWRETVVKRRCRTCYEFLRRNGYDRSPAQIVAHSRRLEESRGSLLYVQGVVQRRLGGT